MSAGFLAAVVVAVAGCVLAAPARSRFTATLGVVLMVLGLFAMGLFFPAASLPWYPLFSEHGRG